MTKIYEAHNHILIHAGYADPAKHRHTAAHIIISLGGEICAAADGTTHHCFGLTIPSGVVHRVDTRKNDVLVFLFACTSNAAKQIQNVRCICRESCLQIAACYASLQQNCTAHRYAELENLLLNRLGIADSLPVMRDERILSAMEYIQARSGEKVSCQEVAAHVHLSQGRFSHLFKEQAGITFAAYSVYQRLMHAFALTFQGKSITESALDAGFSSSAHFADVNRRVFGISASSIARDLHFIKVNQQKSGSKPQSFMI